MATSRKRAIRSKRATGNAPSGRPDTRQMLIQLLPLASSDSGLTDRLFGTAGHGTRDEYDQLLDWERFSEWQTR